MKGKVERFIIKPPLRVATGHQAWAAGCGRHRDKRQRRQRTRSASIRAAVREGGGNQ